MRDGRVSPLPPTQLVMPQPCALSLLLLLAYMMPYLHIARVVFFSASAKVVFRMCHNVIAYKERDTESLIFLPPFTSDVTKTSLPRRGPRRRSPRQAVVVVVVVVAAAAAAADCRPPP